MTDLIQKVREHAEREWGAAAHSQAVTKAIGRHFQAAKDGARAEAFAEILRILRGEEPRASSPAPTATTATAPPPAPRGEGSSAQRSPRPRLPGEADPPMTLTDLADEMDN